MADVRAHAGWMVFMLAACGVRELPAQSPEPATAPTTQASAAAPAPSSSVVPTHHDDAGNDAARANAAKGDAELDAATRDPGRVVNAKAYYEAALIPADNDSFGYAAYKLAHAYWALSDFDRALASFKKAIDFGAAHPDVGGAVAIRVAALRDIVPVFAVQGAPAKAYTFFRVVGGDDAQALQMLESLGRAYDDTGRFLDAKRIYAELRQRDPAHTCRWDVLDRHASPSASGQTVNAGLARCPP